jgi:hypothetical protein
VINPAPPAPPADEEEYPQANRCRCKADDQKDTSNSTCVVEEPIEYEYIDIVCCAVKKAYVEVVPELSPARSVGF